MAVEPPPMLGATATAASTSKRGARSSMKAATAAAERHSNAITAASRQPRHGLDASTPDPRSIRSSCSSLLLAESPVI